MSNEQKPTVGRIVHYRLTADDAERIRYQREKSPLLTDLDCTLSLRGNAESEGQVLPLIVCRVWADEYPDNHPRSLDGVNGQVLLDGNDTLWITSAKQGDEPGCWNWPPRA